MINPNVNKLITVHVEADSRMNKYAVVNGYRLDVNEFQRPIPTGRRRLYLKYSITFDRYYLTNRCI